MRTTKVKEINFFNAHFNDLELWLASSVIRVQLNEPIEKARWNVLENGLTNFHCPG